MNENSALPSYTDAFSISYAFSFAAEYPPSQTRPLQWYNAEGRSEYRQRSVKKVEVNTGRGQ